MSIMPLEDLRQQRDIGGMTFIALTFLGLYLLVLFRVLADDRPRSVPQSHYSPPVNAHEQWSRLSQGAVGRQLR